jgi:hypothetical protein
MFLRYSSLSLIDLASRPILPGSLHYAARRTKTVRKKKPGRSGRDDSKT